MKVMIYADEWYPVYSVVEDGTYAHFEAELPEKLVGDLKRVMRRFNKIQKQVRDAIEEAGK
jgi:hypothetical protein